MKLPDVARQVERAKVLLVESDEVARAQTAAMLSGHCDVTAVADGEGALGLLASQRFDVICASDEVQGMEGAELLDRAAALPQAPRGVLLSGHQDEPSGFVGAPVVQVVFKPFEPQQLVDTVHREYTLARMKRLVSAPR